LDKDREEFRKVHKDYFLRDPALGNYSNAQYSIFNDQYSVIGVSAYTKATAGQPISSISYLFDCFMQY